MNTQDIKLNNCLRIFKKLYSGLIIYCNFIRIIEAEEIHMTYTDVEVRVKLKFKHFVNKTQKLNYYCYNNTIFYRLQDC